MTPYDFRNIWADSHGPLSPITPSRLERFNLRQPVIDFLTIAGLPEYTEPNLSFAVDTDEIIRGIYKLTELHHLYNEVEFEKYIVIGSCRDGDAIVINTDNGDLIEELDHNDMYRPMYFNSSILTLAEFLILYRNFEALVLDDKDPEDNFQCFHFTDEQFETLKNKMFSLDSKAVTERGFWKEELEIMLSLRQEYYRKT